MNCILNVPSLSASFSCIACFTTQVRTVLISGYRSSAQKEATLARSGHTPRSSCRWRRWCWDWRRSRSRRGSATCMCPHSSTTCPRSPGVRILLLLLYDAQGISFSTISWNVYVEILHVLMKKLTRRLDHPAASDEERRSRLPEWRGLSSLPSAALHPHCSQHSPMNKYQQDQWLEYLWGQPE